ncbi:hypothetical protein [Nitrosospira sp. Nsp1]|uniref:hypothetical protein n=1 Tax=Nitrosospira sp. Nsp1 TaxID=136547 RepID=UPI00088DF641|nr:hypothetical protein [Nitrosospira sp. Nsp1]SCX40375.1 hypothetical protein SAMN05720354_10399 [Nitrosospira sp. Nsp1]
MAILDEILALPTELRAEQDTQKIADALPLRITREKTEIGKGTLLEVLGQDLGNLLCDFVDADAEFRHVKHLLANGWLDISLDSVRAGLDAIAAGNVMAGFAQAHADAIKVLAERSSPVDEFEVRKLCWSDDGQWLV